MSGLDDEEYARDDAARAEEEWGPEFERRAEELAELQPPDGGYGYRLNAIWRDGDVEPHDYQLVVQGGDGDGEFVDVAVSAACVVQEALRRQARAWCRSHENTEGPPLEQLLALVPAKYALGVDEGDQRPYEASWEEWDEIVKATGPTRAAAIRAATLELLGPDATKAAERLQLSGSPADLIRAAMAWADWRKELIDHAGDPTLYEAEGPLLEAVEALRGVTTAEPRQTCGSCRHWDRAAEPATEAGARPCGLDRDPQPAPRHPESSCGLPGCYRMLEQSDTEPAPGSGDLPGVTLAGNVIRSEGGES